ncbi:MAG: hypothetical protein IJV64_00990, partial [Oscillospiraceae bacterium]|nr:hypothetical protein [Oscillospiraceae bacterium]
IESVKLAIKNGRITCPICRHRTSQKVEPDTVAQHLTVYCHRCKAETKVNIAQSQCYLDSPC